MIPRRFEVEQVINKVSCDGDVVTEPGAQHEHPPAVLDGVQLEVVHPVPPEQVVPQQHDHPVHDGLVPRIFAENSQQDKQSLLLPRDWRLIIITRAKNICMRNK